MRDPVIPPASLQEVLEQQCFFEVWDNDEASNNGDTLENSQLCHKGKGRASPLGGELSNLTDRNYGGDSRDDDLNSLDSDDDPSITYASGGHAYII